VKHHSSALRVTKYNLENICRRKLSEQCSILKQYFHCKHRGDPRLTKRPRSYVTALVHPFKFTIGNYSLHYVRLVPVHALEECQPKTGWDNLNWCSVMCRTDLIKRQDIISCGAFTFCLNMAQHSGVWFTFYLDIVTLYDSRSTWTLLLCLNIIILCRR
jgi:hypothetical protein